jgi:hypothetical protein
VYVTKSPTVKTTSIRLWLNRFRACSTSRISDRDTFNLIHTMGLIEQQAWFGGHGNGKGDELAGV